MFTCDLIDNKTILNRHIWTETT